MHPRRPTFSNKKLFINRKQPFFAFPLKNCFHKQLQSFPIMAPLDLPYTDIDLNCTDQF